MDVTETTPNQRRTRDDRPAGMDSETRKAFEQSFKKNEEALRRLAKL